MKSSLFAILCALSISLTACSNSTNETAQATDSEDKESIIETVTEAVEEVFDTKEKTIPKGVYKVGDYIKAGSYMIQNQTEDSYSNIIMFSTEESYDNYVQSDRSTLGKESDAECTYAYQNVFLSNNEETYMNLENGNVIVVEYSEVVLSTIDLSSIIDSDQACPFGKALLVVGEDIPSGQYLFECVETDFAGQVTLFETLDSYTSYHTTSRFTVGEESDAIQANAKIDEWLYKDDSFSTYLAEGNIIVIDGGKFKISTME